MSHPNITLNKGSRDTSFVLVLTALETTFSTQKQASHQNAFSWPVFFNFEIEMRCIYHWMLKNIDKWEQFIFLYCDF